MFFGVVHAFLAPFSFLLTYLIDEKIMDRHLSGNVTLPQPPHAVFTLIVKGIEVTHKTRNAFLIGKRPNAGFFDSFFESSPCFLPHANISDVCPDTRSELFATKRLFIHTQNSEILSRKMKFLREIGWRLAWPLLSLRAFICFDVYHSRPDQVSDAVPAYSFPSFIRQSRVSGKGRKSICPDTHRGVPGLY